MNPKEQRQVLDQILVSKKVDWLLEKLNKQGEIYHVLPEVYPIVGFGGKGTGHKDLWEHTKQVVKQTKPKVLLRWAALFHDVGKPSSIRRVKKKIAFYNHEVKSANLFKKLADRTEWFTDEEINKVYFLVENLGRPEQYSKDWSRAAVCRFARDMGEHLEDIMLLARADVTSTHESVRRNVQSQMSELQKRINKYAKEDAKQPPLLKGLGNELMDAFNVKGKHLGDIIDKLKEKIEAGELTERQSHEFYIEHIKANNQDFGI